MSNDDFKTPDGVLDDSTKGILPYRSDRLAIAEGIILLVGLALLDYTGIMPYAFWPVHPFLFVVILLSAQYGLYGGILAATGAILLAHAGGIPARAIDMTYAEYFRIAWANSLTWVVAALMVGVVTTRRGRALREQTDRLLKAKLAQSLIAGQYQVLAQRTHQLERSLAGRRENGTSAEPAHAGPSQQNIRTAWPKPARV